VLEIALAVVRQFLLFAALLTPLELLRPAHRDQRLVRKGTLTDLVYFTVSPFLITFGAALLLGLFAALLGFALPGRWRALLAAQPWGLQLVEIVLASELLGYFVHRLSHRVPFLWRFHSVHHSAESLDWLAAHRQHPLEAVWLLGVANLPALALGFDVEPLAGFVLFQKLHTAFVHANANMGFGRATLVLASPQFHHWHHERRAESGNYASLLPFIDRLFGTYRLPEGFPSRYGVDAPVPATYPGQLLHPLLR
jgi:sterol desaturase/sphingolipid hydroxylase (fatty acid hydroxylase superfamily)